MTKVPSSEGDAPLLLPSSPCRGEDVYAWLHNKALGTVLDMLPEAIYLTDKDGFIIYYNPAAATLWGVNPPLGTTQYCGAWKLCYPDGTPLCANACSMALALQEQRPVYGRMAIAMRPNGTFDRFLAFAAPAFDSEGTLIGAVNILLISTHQTGTEEPDIPRRLRRNGCIENNEPVSRRKDRSLVEIPQSVSPIKNIEGRIIGAAKIARIITLRRYLDEQRSLLTPEMDHRLKKLFALAKSALFRTP